MIKAVIFDLDNTLLPESAFWDAAFAAVCGDLCAHQGIALPALQAVVFGAADGIWRASPHFGAHDGAGFGTPSWLFSDFAEVPPVFAHLTTSARVMQGEAWSVGFATAGIHADARRYAEAFRLQLGSHHRAYDDVLPALESLRDDYALAVLTNGPGDLQREKIKVSGLTSWFPTVAISGELGFGKPGERAFEYTLAALGVSAGEAVMVGDSLERDIAGAAAAGMAAIWLNRTAERPIQPPPVVATELTGLRAALASMNQAAMQ
jgi:putative hydrolase of the HAD superfamily